MNPLERASHACSDHLYVDIEAIDWTHLVYAHPRIDPVLSSELMADLW